MKILKTIEKIPGGMMMIPLLLGCVVNTFFPAFLEIGGFTTALFSNKGAPTLVGMFIFCCGASINVKQFGMPFYKGAILTIVKFAIGTILGVMVGYLFGTEGIIGITPLAVIAAITNSNSVMYSILARQYGVPSDVGAISLLALNDGPFFTMIALGVSGLANIPFMAIVAVLVPLLLGMLLGNLDEDFRNLCEKGLPIIIPFNGFCLGAGMNLRDIVKAGVPGIILGLVCLVSTGFGCYFAYNLFFGRKKKSAVGAALGTTAGNAVATPRALGEADPALASYANTATAQVAAACVVTAILCPLFTSFMHKRLQKKNLIPLDEKAESI